MSKNDPTGKTHATVTKTTSNPGASTELMTPKNFLSGLSGILADCAANESDSTSVGSGKGTRTQSMRAGIDGSVNLKPSKSSSTNFGR
jgi:hypothetical protein